MSKGYLIQLNHAIRQATEKKNQHLHLKKGNFAQSLAQSSNERIKRAYLYRHSADVTPRLRESAYTINILWTLDDACLELGRNAKCWIPVRMSWYNTAKSRTIRNTCQLHHEMKRTALFKTSISLCDYMGIYVS